MNRMPIEDSQSRCYQHTALSPYQLIIVIPCAELLSVRSSVDLRHASAHTRTTGDVIVVTVAKYQLYGSSQRPMTLDMPLGEKKRKANGKNIFGQNTTNLVNCHSEGVLAMLACSGEHLRLQ